MFPDYQGPTATVGVGRLAAPIVLDGIRAAVLNESALAAGPYRPDYIGKSVLDAVRKHSLGRAQNDDIALVCFGRLEPSRATGQEPPTAPPPRVPA